MSKGHKEYPQKKVDHVDTTDSCTVHQAGHNNPEQ